jgi:large-conductance mechanosensitive channel
LESREGAVASLAAPTRILNYRTLIAALVVFVMIAGSFFVMVARGEPAAVWTEKTSGTKELYFVPGETVVIKGSGFLPGG